MPKFLTSMQTRCGGGYSCHRAIETCSGEDLREFCKANPTYYFCEGDSQVDKAICAALYTPYCKKTTRIC